MTLEYVQIDTNLTTGETTEIRRPYTAEELVDLTEQKWEWLRRTRDRYLKESDWTQSGDLPEALRTSWATYRQQLRDLPANTTDPFEVVFPTKPTE